MAQVGIQLDAAQLAGVVSSFREYQIAEQQLERVVASILLRAQIKDVVGWKLRAEDSMLIVECPDPTRTQNTNGSTQVLSSCDDSRKGSCEETTAQSECQ